MTEQSYFQLIPPLIFVVFAIGFFSIWFFDRVLRAALVFSISYGLCAFGFILDFYRDPSDILTGYLTIIPFMLTPFVFSLAYCELMRVQKPWRFLIATLLTGMMFYVWFRHIDDNIVARTITVNVAVSALFAVGVFAVLGSMQHLLHRILFAFVFLTSIQGVPRMIHLIFIDTSTLTPENYASSTVALVLQFVVSISALCIAMILFMIFGVEIVNRLNREAEQKRDALQKQFAQFLSPEVVRQLTQSESAVSLAVEDRDITVLLIDIRGFTALSEQHGSENAVLVANHFFSIVSDEVFARSGTIDKYMGDAVLAFWNAPLDQTNHAILATECANAIVERLKRENVILVSKGLPPITAVATLESGFCSVGNMGTKERVDYTAVGPAVNMVSRLENAAKERDLTIVAGPQCATRSNGYWKFGERISLRGFDSEIEIFLPAPVAEKPM